MSSYEGACRLRSLEDSRTTSLWLTPNLEEYRPRNLIPFPCGILALEIELFLLSNHHASFLMRKASGSEFRCYATAA